ncbi:DinB family protein [Clostridium sp. UBA6640]|uniref:DinB family protein n=1 Tax=Clostridium sp. UBA6640 TaxID=1946370 RepID=UPI0025C6A9D7|nr:DinB family protein [Clostridium sp. UBA6640]
MDLNSWNNEIKQLREIILKPDRIEESKYLSLNLHSMVHLSVMSGIDKKTFEDKLWEELDENTFRTSTNKKGRTVAYGVWHSTRIEDITINLLVAGEEQIFNVGNWQKKINSKIIDTGNAMSENEILEFGKNIHMEELKNYRIEVGRRTQDIIKNLSIMDMKRKFDKHRLQCIIDEGAVLDVEASNWLIDFWGRKTVSGTILMPVTRHNIVHINESLSAKKKLKIIKS